MNVDPRAGVLEVIDQLRKAGSWAGRTHIQKTIFLLQELHAIDLGYEYTLYKHGPYSFELDADIEEMRSLGILDYDIVASGYGPRYQLGASAHLFKKTFDEKASAVIASVANEFGVEGVRNLECISTLVMCAKNDCDLASCSENLKDCVKQLKPHLSDAEIIRAWNLLSSYHCLLRHSANTGV